MVEIGVESLEEFRGTGDQGIVGDEPRLHQVGKLAQPHRAGHAGTALERVQRAAQLARARRIARHATPGAKLFAGLWQELRGLVEKDRQHLIVDVVVRLNERRQRLLGQTCRGGAFGLLRVGDARPCLCLCLCRCRRFGARRFGGRRLRCLRGGENRSFRGHAFAEVRDECGHRFPDLGVVNVLLRRLGVGPGFGGSRSTTDAGISACPSWVASRSACVSASAASGAPAAVCWRSASSSRPTSAASASSSAVKPVRALMRPTSCVTHRTARANKGSVGSRIAGTSCVRPSRHCSIDFAVVAISGKPAARWMPHSVWLARTITADGSWYGSSSSRDISCANVAKCPSASSTRML